MKKVIIILIGLILVVGVFYVFSKKEAKVPVVENSTNSTTPNSAPSEPAVQPQAQPQTQTNVKNTPGADYTPPQATGGGENAGSNIQVYEVDFDGTAYSPSVSSLRVGDYIFFKNKSSGNFWPVAGSANTIAAYPQFNPKSPIAAGGEYKFQFSKAGNWSFGDNLKANSVFTVNVSQ